MSTEAWIFNHISLKYMSTVKTVQVLWRQSNIGDDVKNFFNDIFQRRDESPHSRAPLQRTITRKFDSLVDNLMLPQPIKNDLSLFFWQLSKGMMDWLKFTLLEMPLEDDPNVPEKVSYFVDNIVFDNVGCVNGRKMMESYVSNRETIDFETWAQLCNCCSEDYIRRFSNTVNWEKCQFESFISIFWFYTLYGAFPRGDMFSSIQDYIIFLNELGVGEFERDRINRTVFIEALSRENLPAVKFFWNRLTEAEKLKLSSNEDIFKTEYHSIAIYLLGQMKFKYPSSEPMYSGPWGSLWGWPWVLFIDTWLDKYKDMDVLKFIGLFHSFLDQREAEEREDGREQFSRRQIMGHLHIKYYIPFEKLWKLSVEKFGLMGEHVPPLAGMIFNAEDIILCKILTEGSTSTWRKFLLIGIGNYCAHSRSLPSQDFREQFMREILVTDEERESLQEIVRYVSWLR